jgi:hypothetical protein
MEKSAVEQYVQSLVEGFLNPIQNSIEVTLKENEQVKKENEELKLRIEELHTESLEDFILCKKIKTYTINMGAEGGFWGRPKEKIWHAEINLVSKEDYDALQSENDRLRKALEFYANDSWDLGCGCCQEKHSEVFKKRDEVAREALKKS